MDRRDFVKAAGTLAATVALAGEAVAADKPESGRQVLPINRGWRYSAKAADGAHAPGFDDAAWARVTVPHTNVALPWHNFEDREYEFVSLYRRHFKLPASAKGKHVFVDFEGVMTAATVWINGHRLGEYKGGYTPFSFDLTDHLNWDGDNVLAVDVDSTERPDIPPFGFQVDYLTFGGIYREVALRVVGAAYIDNIFARPQNVLSGKPGLEVDCHLKSFAATGPLRVEAVLKDGKKTIAKASATVDKADGSHTIRFAPISGIKLWDLDHTNLYTVDVTLLENGKAIDTDCRRFGFRQAQFTDHGFEINGKVVKLRGLDRHQTFPFVGQAMAGRGQRRDAWILRKELKCNIVRTSHYPQSRHFLDACDELGLLVLEEIPGWQHIGDLAWQDIAVDNVERMITRDWNHPAIILWGVRINESPDSHDFYVRTNAAAHRLDPTRQTGGIRNKYESELLEDVFTMNDFGFPLRVPNHPCYLNTEFSGHMYPVKSFDDNARHREHVVRHARVHDQIASDARFAGGIAWCAFDYNTHAEFGAGDRICYHGVTDIFRAPKPVAAFYRSQCEPSEEIV
ncbi:MAG: glycoside hydrolase family 2 TIM barrel-domain containing protein, partial [Rhizomicrobium sp.]